MKVGIDARLFGPRVGGGGIGRYVEELVKHLATESYGHRYVLFVKPEAKDLVPSAAHFEVREADVHWYGMKEQLVMPRIIDREGLDLVHVPHWNVALGMKTPFVTTVHDLILLEEPRSARATTLPGPLYALKYMGYKQVLNHAVRKSRGIIAPSAYVKGSILHHFPRVDAAKIQVIHEGLTALPVPTGSLPDSLVSRPYFLCVGNAYPHKNLEAALHAFSFFAPQHPEARLVFAGRKDKFRERFVAEARDIGLPEGSVQFISNPSDADLARLYAHATLYIFPSRSEGFGLPPLEALAAGVPVAAANTSSLPEILGDAADYFAPDDIERLVALMEDALTTRSEERIARGKMHASQYSWKRMTDETAALYTTFAR
jgi:glycosyltransferase involved in cell wall biosynthesis